MRNDILQRRSEINEWIAQSRSKAYICRELNCKPETLNFYLDRMGIEYVGNKGNKGFKAHVGSIPASYYLKNQGPFIKSHKLRLKLLDERIKDHRCEECKETEWLGGPIPLELHHLNGQHEDNRLENLQLLCPNCHSLTPNHAGKGKRALVSQLAEEHGLEP